MSTYTFATLEVSKETFDEIHKLLDAAGYEHSFHDYPDGRVIDMHGIGLKKKSEPKGAFCMHKQAICESPFCENSGCRLA